MKFGICGYGNLGKAVEKTINSFGGEIVGIFSRRKNVKSAFGTKVFDFQDAKNFNLDVMFMCGGSQQDLLWQSPEICKYFNVIDTFDTHAKIQEHKNNLQKVATESGHVAIYSCGWDPGIFSAVRVLANSIFKTYPQTFWGKGVSQGHSEALRNIVGVADAVQFTIPNQEVYEMVKRDHSFVVNENDKHERHCYICLDETRNKEDVLKEISQTENYFKGQKVYVEICSQEKINELKKNMFHKGVVFSGDSNSQMDLFVDMKSNPEFTSKIMYAYANAIPKLSAGAYSPLDIPISFVGNENFEKLI